MRVIPDSNILFSALISPHTPPHRIYQAWRQGVFELVTCDKRAGILSLIASGQTQILSKNHEPYHDCN
jgi:predicted nucleic acid-binding protein